MIDTLCFAGGGYKCISYLGALNYLHLSEKLNYIKFVYGASMGSIIATLYSCDYSPNEIFDIISEFSLYLNDFDLSKILLNFGIEDGNKVIDIVLKYIKKKLNIHNPSLLELNKLNRIKTQICYYDLTKSELTNADLHLPIATILKASCCIPLISTKTFVNESYLIDPYCYYKTEDLIIFWNLDNSRVLCISPLNKKTNLNNESIVCYILKILRSINENDSFLKLKYLQFYKIPNNLNVISTENYSKETLFQEYKFGYEYMKKTT